MNDNVLYNEFDLARKKATAMKIIRDEPRLFAKAIFLVTEKGVMLTYNPEEFVIIPIDKFVERTIAGEKIDLKKTFIQVEAKEIKSLSDNSYTFVLANAPGEIRYVSERMYLIIPEPNQGKFCYVYRHKTKSSDRMLCTAQDLKEELLEYSSV